jgi:hypothetical protein
MRSRKPFVFSRLEKSGQGTLAAVFILGVAMAVFSWVAMASLDRRDKESLITSRQFALRSLELQLQQMMRSPNYVNALFFKKNPEIQDFLERSPTTPNDLIELSDLQIFRASGEPWFGKNSVHTEWTLENCQTPTPNCVFKSVVSALMVHEKGVGYLHVELSFVPQDSVQLKSPFNPQKNENKIVLWAPLNFYGVEIKEQKISCLPDFKAIMIAQQPGEFLCLRQ